MRIISAIILVLAACFHSVPAATVYTNPVVTADVPDPSVIRVGSSYYLYGTGYYVYTSTTDMSSWTRGSRIFSAADWAPDVYLHTNGTYYLYYTNSAGNDGVAHSSTPTGTFTNDNSTLGMADMHMFRDDDGQLYLYGVGWAGAGSLVGINGVRMVDPVTPPAGDYWVRGLVKPDSNRVDQVWEWEGTSWKVCEGPWMVKHNGVYYMMYSGSGWAGETYAVGYATATNPMGPFTKYPGNPIIRRSASENIYGPGHHSVVKDQNGVHWVAYHQRAASGYVSGTARQPSIDPMWFDSSGVIHCHATRGVARPAPGTNPWPARSAYSAIEVESHNGWSPRLTLTVGTVGYISGTYDSGYLAFRTVDFGAAGAGKVILRRLSVSSAGAAVGTVSVRLGGVSGTVIAACAVTGTGNAWRSDTFALNRVMTGAHDIVVTFDASAAGGTVGNLDWLQFTAGPATGAMLPVQAKAAPAADRPGRSVYNLQGVRVKTKPAAGIVVTARQGAAAVKVRD